MAFPDRHSPPCLVSLPPGGATPHQSPRQATPSFSRARARSKTDYPAPCSRHGADRTRVGAVCPSPQSCPCSPRWRWESGSSQRAQMKTSLPANQQRLVGASRKRQMNSLRSVAAGSVALPGPRLAPAPTLRCNGAPGSGWGLGHFSPSPNPVLTDLLTGSATVTWPEFADGERGWASWARRTGERGDCRAQGSQPGTRASAFTTGRKHGPSFIVIIF